MPEPSCVAEPIAHVCPHWFSIEYNIHSTEYISIKHGKDKRVIYLRKPIYVKYKYKFDYICEAKFDLQMNSMKWNEPWIILLVYYCMSDEVLVE